MTFVGRLVFEDESASGPDAASLDFLVSGLLALADIPLLDSRPLLDIMACDLLNHHHSCMEYQLASMMIIAVSSSVKHINLVHILHEVSFIPVERIKFTTATIIPRVHATRLTVIR